MPGFDLFMVPNGKPRHMARRSIAEQYPAQPQEGGGYLFRPHFKGKNPPALWGWTQSLDLAHDDYFDTGEVPVGCQRIEINGRPVLVNLKPGVKGLTDEDVEALNAYATALENETLSTDERLHDEMVASEAAEKETDGPEQRAQEGSTGVHEGAPRDDDAGGEETGAGSPPRRDEQEDDAVTELTKTGPDTGRYTDHMRYRLPPELERAEVKFDGYKRYKLPSPSTGKLTAYTRSTTVSSTTGDMYNLGLWKQRTKVVAVLIAAEASRLMSEFDAEGGDQIEDQMVDMFGRVFQGSQVDELADLYHELLAAYENGKAQDPNKVIDKIDNYCGGAEAREHGQAVHEWLGAVDSGQVLLWQVPEEYVVHVASYQDCLKRAGLIAVPIYVERIVLNDYGDETIAGTIDRIYYCVETGEYYLGDLKTSKTLEFSALEYGIQFAIYGYARYMLRLDGTGWDEMPVINQEQCFCVHVPSDQPERSQVVPFYLWPGGEFAVTAIEVRKQRKEADKKIFGGAYPTPSVTSLRYVEARQALQNMHDVEEAQAIMAEYADVWDDELTDFGRVCFEAIAV